MSPRLFVGIPLVLSLAACELPEPAGTAPTQAGIASGPATIKPKLKPTIKPDKGSKLKPTKRPPLSPLDPPKDAPSERPKDEPSEPPKDEPTPPPPPPAPTGEETGPLVGLRAAHNQARAAVGLAPLAWSTEVAATAQSWANQLAANGCQPAHQPSSAYGQNLYWSSHASTAAAATAAWVAESAHYDATTHTCAQGQVCGHYTQIVWSATTRLGCGRATCGSAEVWVCMYDPRGNYNGQAPF